MGGDAQSRVGLEKSVAVVLSGTIFPTSANAGVAQLVEHFLAKEDVARSNRVTRSTFSFFNFSFNEGEVFTRGSDPKRFIAPRTPQKAG